jgi:hypothetical protein
MKIYRVLLFVFVAFALLFVSSQAFASPGNLPYDNNNTPGVRATEKAEEKATEQANDAKDDAKENQLKGKREHFKGTVTAADFSSITLSLRDGSSVTIGLTGDTRLKFPGPKDSALTSIQVGATANVQAIRDESNNLVALRVLIMPNKPSKIHRVGIVTEYTPGASITIQDKDGNTYTFTIPGEIKILPPERAGELAVGSRVTIIAPRDPATGGVIVKGIVVHPAKP